MAVEGLPQHVADGKALVEQGEEELAQLGGHGGAVGWVEPYMYIYIYGIYMVESMFIEEEGQ